MCKLWERMNLEVELGVKVAAFANLIDSLCKEGYFNEVFEIAEEMPCGSSLSEEVVYGQMIDSFCKVGRYHGAARIVYLMRKRGFIPSDVSYNFIIHGLSKDGDCMRGYQLLEEGVEFGFSLCEHTYKSVIWPSGIHDNFVYAAVLKGICGSGKFNEACHFLEAYQIVREMNRNGVIPDCVTWRVLHKLQSNVRKHTSSEDLTLSTVDEGDDMVGIELKERKFEKKFVKDYEITRSDVTLC
ncbi:hypothetical protein TSUD_177850 [Trifolium subterraneum]|uniref:Pentacotripeptide-repeat region of PRORP domain-containing protein n=1 Tax=Trifolium subterraneum TaxID=3900 RepID=A0A2Z6LIV7_TRISU|nr:hypothetical protein TSUD_177850 [Trifolium subterraneum]